MGKRTRRRNRSAQPGAGTSAPLGQALDLAVPPERVADSMLAFYEGQHVPGELAFEIVREAPRSARDVARAALELEPATLPALTLAGCVAEALWEDDVWVAYCRKAVELSPDRMTRRCCVPALQRAGSNADALDELERPSCGDPREWEADPLYRDSYVEAFRRGTRLSASDECLCGVAAARGMSMSPHAAAGRCWGRGRGRGSWPPGDLRMPSARRSWPG